MHVDLNVCLSVDKFDRQYWICGRLCRTLVVVLAPHEDAAPVGQIIRNNRQSVPPGLHHSLHIVKAGVAAQVSRLKPCINLGCFLQLNDLLCRLGGGDKREISTFCIIHRIVIISRAHSLHLHSLNFYGDRSEAAAKCFSSFQWLTFLFTVYISCSQAGSMGCFKDLVQTVYQLHLILLIFCLHNTTNLCY